MKLEEKENKIEKKVEKVKNEKQSLAYEMLLEQRKQNKRLFIIIVLLCVILAGITCYTIWLLNDIETVETTETTEDYDINQNSGDGGNNNFINGNENEVNN